MRNRIHASALPLVVALTTAGAPLPAQGDISLDLISIAAGTWAYLPVNDDAAASALYSKLAPAAYLTLHGFKLFATLPLANTLQLRDGKKSAARTAAGDLQMYAGRSLGVFEPRIGFSAPLYRTGDVWIGTGDVTIQGGGALNPSLHQVTPVTVQAEAMIVLSLGRTGAHTRAGSLVIPFSVKGTLQPSQRVKAGAELLGSVARRRWTWASEGHEGGFGLVPHFFVAVRTGDVLHAGIKGGAGPQFTRQGKVEKKWHHSGTNIHGALYLELYPRMR